MDPFDILDKQAQGCLHHQSSVLCYVEGLWFQGAGLCQGSVRIGRSSHRGWCTRDLTSLLQTQQLDEVGVTALLARVRLEKFKAGEPMSLGLEPGLVLSDTPVLAVEPCCRPRTGQRAQPFP